MTPEEKAQNLADILGPLLDVGLNEPPETEKSPEPTQKEKAQNVADILDPLYDDLYGKNEFLLNAASKALPLSLMGAGITAGIGLLEKFPKIPDVGFGGP